MKLQRKPKPQRRKSLNGNYPIEETFEIGAEIATKYADNSKIVYGVPENFKKGLAIIATSAWRARCRIIDPASGEVREEMQRLSGDIERIQRCLGDLGITVEDHTNKPFDYGLPWKVVATKSMPGLAREIVTETLKPTVRWNEQIIQHAEVEVGTPV
jgi:hypothetical protein